MNGNDSIIRAILNQKKQILMAGVWILIAEAIFGFFVILSQVWDPLIGKIQAIFLILAIGMFVSLASFSLMEDKNVLVRKMGALCFASCMLGIVLWILIILEVLPVEVASNSSTGRAYAMSIWIKTTIIAWATFMSALICGAMVRTEENSNLVLPLKLTCIVSLAIAYVLSIVLVILDFNLGKNGGVIIAELMGFSILVMVITGIATTKISSNAKEAQKKLKASAGMNNGPKTDAELRAEIEEKVRREMIEKEVREEFEKQKREQEEFERQVEASENNNPNPPQVDNN